MTGGDVMRRVRDDERGGVLILVTFALIALLGFAALVIDVGNGRLHDRRLQTAVDLGLLAGAQKLPDTKAAANDAEEIAELNWAKNSKVPINLEATTGCRVKGCLQPDKITMEAEVDVPTYLAKLFGIDNWDIHAKGAACGPCEVTTQKFDVMVVLDRSYSMCLDSNGNAYANGVCRDLNWAKDGILSMLTFFDPGYDRVGLTVLSSGDNKAPFSSTGTYPCDGANPNEPGTTSNYFRGTLGDFMDGTPTNHDSWVLSPLASNFKNANGSINYASQLVSTVQCLKNKYWTPVAPAIEAARLELAANPRPGAKQFIVLMGDGGANMQPMRRNAQGQPQTPNPPGVKSWYTPTTGNNLRACADAIAQAQLAKNAGIEIFSIGYDLNAADANKCRRDNDYTIDNSYNATTTLGSIASPNVAPGEKHFFNSPPGNVTEIFNAIGRQITGGGTRLIE